MTMFQCLLNQTISMWTKMQKLEEFVLVGLGNNNGGGGNNLTWAGLRYHQTKAILNQVRLSDEAQIGFKYYSVICWMDCA